MAVLILSLIFIMYLFPLTALAAGPEIHPPEIHPPEIHPPEPVKPPVIHKPEVAVPDSPKEPQNGDSPNVDSPALDLAKDTFNDMIKEGTGIDPNNPKIQDISGEALKDTWGKIEDINGYIGAAITTIQGIEFYGDAKDAIRYYKYLKLHFKDPAEIKKAWQAMMNGGFGSAKNFEEKYKNLLGKGKEFWKGITKEVDLLDAYTTGAFGKPAKYAAKFLGKATPFFAAWDTVSSSLDAFSNFSNGNYSEGIANVGEALMAGSAVLSATGVGAPVAAGVAIVGGVLWAGAKIYQHREFIGKIAKAVYNMTPIGQVTNAVKTAVSEGIKNVAAKTIDTVKGLFS
ncbi:hypothetical protein [Polycladomyces subterraneus]|uniref:Uncharacterized protein n=1 Tax=Polycladomyces subterraneus TaxID=1016997 RepID=A0ABT8IL69_9BACL|nr:hypothetical protein [Polycladomyces subterraneus]MDN4593527.1 hypothetical protein [Polycladomyces subterraneus]